MDLMESTLFNPPTILLQTVLEEVRHRSLPLYNRLKALLKADEKNISVFYNEFHSYVYCFVLQKATHLVLPCIHYFFLRRETVVVREEGETPNDKNDRGVFLLRSDDNHHN